MGSDVPDEGGAVVPIPPPAAPAFEPGRNGRILIVDDNRAIHEDFRKVLGAQLDDSELDALHAELFGTEGDRPADPVELQSAYQGDEALRMAAAARRAGRPHALAFVDVRMPPGIDGIETTRRLLAEDPDIGIVVCSAYSDHTWEDMAAAFGDTDRVLILKKPFDTVEVRQLACALQRRWQLARTAALRLEELAAMVEAQTGELRAANAKLEVEAEKREHMLRELYESHEQIRLLAYHDGLTGLPNRRSFNELLEKSLARARRNDDGLAVLFVDFDNFKRINDSLGHHVADAVLQQLAEALGRIVRSTTSWRCSPATRTTPSSPASAATNSSSCCRCARDRFAPGVVAQRILRHMSQPVRAGEHELFVTASIGIATYPDDGESGELLLRNADAAMYHAKQLGKAGYQYYSEAMNAASAERLALEARLAPSARAATAGSALSTADRPGKRAHHRRRSAAALERSAARYGLARRLHSARRGDGADPAHQRVGTQSSLPPGDGMAACRTARRAHRGQRFRRAVQPSGRERRRAARARPERPRSGAARYRDHGIGDDARARPRRGPAARAARARGALVPGRLRHGLLIVELSASIPHPAP